MCGVVEEREIETERARKDSVGLFLNCTASLSLVFLSLVAYELAVLSCLLSCRTGQLGVRVRTYGSEYSFVLPDVPESTRTPILIRQNNWIHGKICMYDDGGKSLLLSLLHTYFRYVSM